MRRPLATRCRRGAPSSTSRPRRCICRIAGRSAADLRPRPALRARGQRSHGRRAEHRRAVDRAAPGRVYQLREDGRTVIGGSYAHYVGRYTSSIFGRNTPVGNSGRVTEPYNGPRGPGLRFCACLRSVELHRVSGRSRPPTSSSRREPRIAADSRFTLSAAQTSARRAVRAMYVAQGHRARRLFHRRSDHGR